MLIYVLEIQLTLRARFRDVLAVDLRKWGHRCTGEEPTLRTLFSRQLNRRPDDEALRGTVPREAIVDQSSIEALVEAKDDSQLDALIEAALVRGR